MNFRDFETQMKSLTAFNLNDVRKFDPGFHRQQFQPAIGHPAAVLPVVRRLKREVVPGFRFALEQVVQAAVLQRNECPEARRMLIDQGFLGAALLHVRRTCNDMRRVVGASCGCF